jgi:hypothetical protein
MIKKWKGTFVENMQIMQLCETDLNFILHVIWGHHLIPHATSKKAMDAAQYALPGQTCNNAVLHKNLFLDLSCQTLTPGVKTDFDVTAAFDQVLSGISIITLADVEDFQRQLVCSCITCYPTCNFISSLDLVDLIYLATTMKIPIKLAREFYRVAAPPALSLQLTRMFP